MQVLNNYGNISVLGLTNLKFPSNMQISNWDRSSFFLDVLWLQVQM